MASSVFVPPRVWKWRNFTESEVCCRHCGELYLDANAMDSLQMARDLLNEPMRINSAHRCAIHNAHVGGAPFSAAEKAVWATYRQALRDLPESIDITRSDYEGCYQQDLQALA